LIVANSYSLVAGWSWARLALEPNVSILSNAAYLVPCVLSSCIGLLLRKADRLVFSGSNEDLLLIETSKARTGDDESPTTSKPANPTVSYANALCDGVDEGGRVWPPRWSSSPGSPA
jgi:hypothetical protein